jgi:pilus assembly protein Flp/PilA
MLPHRTRLHLPLKRRIEDRLCKRECRWQSKASLPRPTQTSFDKSWKLPDIESAAHRSIKSPGSGGLIVRSNTIAEAVLRRNQEVGTLERMSYGKALFKLVEDESGQDLIEYALVAALIALGAVASMRTLTTTISTALANLGTRLTNAV